MIGLSAPTFDVTGSIYLFQGQVDAATFAGLFDRKRRTSKYRTLDLGVVVVDAGHSQGDRSLAVTITGATPDQAATITRLVERYAVLLLATPGGCYRVSPESCQGDGTNIKINLSFISEA